jgi:hypothetical protein
LRTFSHDAPSAGFSRFLLSRKLVSYVTNVNQGRNSEKCLESNTQSGHIRGIGIGPQRPLAGRVNENQTS